MTSLLATTVGERDNKIVLEAWLLMTADCPYRWLEQAIANALATAKWTPTIAELRARVAAEVLKFIRFHCQNKRGHELHVDIDKLMTKAEKVDRYIALARTMENLDPVRPMSAPLPSNDLPEGWERRLSTVQHAMSVMKDDLWDERAVDPANEPQNRPDEPPVEFYSESGVRR